MIDALSDLQIGNEIPLPSVCRMFKHAKLIPREIMVLSKGTKRAKQ